MKQYYFTTLLIFSYLASFSQAGTLDKNFGDNGISVTSDPSLSIVYYSSIVLDNDKIAVASNKTINRQRSVGVYQYLPDGQPDVSFGREGFAILPGSGSPRSLIKQKDNKLITYGITGRSIPQPEYAKLQPDGKPDSSFGTTGFFTDTSLPFYNQAYDIAQQADGKLVSCSRLIYDVLLGVELCVITRINENGTLDKTFGDNGHVIFDEGDFAPTAITVQADGKIVCAGAFRYNGYSCGLFRFNSDGTLDKTFGINGSALATFNIYEQSFQDLVIQPDGKIVAVGSAGDNSFGKVDPFWAIARFNADGSLDLGFGEKGKAVVQIPDAYAHAESVALQQNKKIVVGGWISSENSAFAVARFTENGLRDSSFSDSGLAVNYINLPDAAIGQDISIQSTGRIILGGYTVYNNIYSVALAGYNSESQATLPIAKIKTWVRDHVLRWQHIYTSGQVDYYAIEKSSSATGGFYTVKRAKAESLPQPLITPQTITYSYNIAQQAIAGATDTSYYRIKAVYENGNVVYSEIISDAFATANAFTISPNPVKNVMKISGLPANRKSTINIVNRNGNVLQTAVSNSSICNMNVSLLKSGVYTVQVVSNGNAQTVKLVKE